MPRVVDARSELVGEKARVRRLEPFDRENAEEPQLAGELPRVLARPGSSSRLSTGPSTSLQIPRDCVDTTRG